MIKGQSRYDDYMNEKSHQGDGSRVLGDRLYKHGVRGGGQITVYLDNFVDDYHICGLIVIWHITNLALISSKPCHAPLPKIQNTGT